MYETKNINAPTKYDFIMIMDETVVMGHLALLNKKYIPSVIVVLERALQYVK